jgi:hypothetical protein
MATGDGIVNERSRFVVTFMPAPGTDGVRALRWLLKRARRQYGLIAIDAREIQDTPTTVIGAFGQLQRDVRGRLRGRS